MRWVEQNKKIPGNDDIHGKRERDMKRFRTMGDIWREQNQKQRLKVHPKINLGVLFQKAGEAKGVEDRSYMEKGQGRLHVSGWKSDESSWNTNPFHPPIPKSRRKKQGPIIRYEPRIQCQVHVTARPVGEEDLIINLQCDGIDFLEEAFTKSQKDYGADTGVYYIRVSCSGKKAYLILSTIGDILEWEVVPWKKGVEQIFDEEIYIPELGKVYEPPSMEVVKDRRSIMIRYKKIEKRKESKI